MFFLGAINDIPVAPAEFTRDVLVTILKHQDGSFEHFNGVVLAFGVGGMIDICFLTRADAAIYFSDDLAAQHLEEQHARARIEDLFTGRAVGLVAFRDAVRREHLGF